MKIVTCIYGQSERYRTLLEVFLYSCVVNTNFDIYVFYSGLEPDYCKKLNSRFGDQLHLVDTKIEIIPREEGQAFTSQKSYFMGCFAPQFDALKGQDLLFIDCDTLVLNENVNNVFEKEFDFAYAVRDPLIQKDPKFKINNGVWFLRNSSEVQTYLERYHNLTELILNDADLNNFANTFWGGADQFAVPLTFESHDVMAPVQFGAEQSCVALPIPCSEYNLIEDWSVINESTKIIHYKSSWPTVLFEEDFRKGAKKAGWRWKGWESWESAYQIWRRYYREYQEEFKPLSRLECPSSDWQAKFDTVLKDGYISKKYSREKRLGEKLEYIDTFLPELKKGGGRVLDIGPGPGEFLELCRAFGNEGVGVDAYVDDSEMGNEYMQLASLMSSRQQLDVRYINCLDTIKKEGQLPLESGTFTHINLQGSIEQLFRDYLEGVPHKVTRDCKQLRWVLNDGLEKMLRDFLNEMCRILAPGGVLHISGNGSANNNVYSRVLKKTLKKAPLSIEQTYSICHHKLMKHL